jgi:hypothetical protein
MQPTTTVIHTYTNLFDTIFATTFHRIWSKGGIFFNLH